MNSIMIYYTNVSIDEFCSLSAFLKYLLHNH